MDAESFIDQTKAFRPFAEVRFISADIRALFDRASSVAPTMPFWNSEKSSPSAALIDPTDMVIITPFRALH